jgi:hypothetical protein
MMVKFTVKLSLAIQTYGIRFMKRACVSPTILPYTTSICARKRMLIIIHSNCQGVRREIVALTGIVAARNAAICR